jgi:hypothetical protein
MSDPRLKNLESFLFFVKRMKLAKSTNDTKYDVQLLKKYSNNLVASLYFAFIKTPTQLTMAINEKWGLRNLPQNYIYHASEYLNVPEYIVKDFWQCKSYNDLIYFIEKTIKELPNKKYLVKTINRQASEIIAIQSCSYFNIPRAAKDKFTFFNEYLVAEEYPLSKLLEGILD